MIDEIKLDVKARLSLRYFGRIKNINDMVNQI